MKNESKDKFPYKVPEGYFEEMSKVWAEEAIAIGTKKFVSQNLRYMAIAAIFLLSFGGLVVYQTLSKKVDKSTEFANQGTHTNLQNNNGEVDMEEYNRLVATLIADTQPKAQPKSQPRTAPAKSNSNPNTEEIGGENLEPEPSKSQEQKEADAILEYLKYYDVDIYETL